MEKSRSAHRAKPPEGQAFSPKAARVIAAIALALAAALDTAGCARETEEHAILVLPQPFLTDANLTMPPETTPIGAGVLRDMLNTYALFRQRDWRATEELSGPWPEEPVDSGLRAAALSCLKELTRNASEGRAVAQGLDNSAGAFAACVQRSAPPAELLARRGLSADVTFQNADYRAAAAHQAFVTCDGSSQPLGSIPPAANVSGLFPARDMHTLCTPVRIAGVSQGPALERQSLNTQWYVEISLGYSNESLKGKLKILLRFTEAWTGATAAAPCTIALNQTAQGLPAAGFESTCTHTLITQEQVSFSEQVKRTGDERTESRSHTTFIRSIWSAPSPPERRARDAPGPPQPWLQDTTVDLQVGPWKGTVSFNGPESTPEYRMSTALESTEGSLMGPSAELK